MVSNISIKKYCVRTYRSSRNRQISFSINAVDVDEKGNIIRQPLTERLKCFANPVDYYFGLYDRKFRHYNADGTYKESPFGCAGCKVAPACATVVDKRINIDPELSALRDAWEADAQRLTGDEKYEHPSFGRFRAAIEARGWTTCNDAALADLRKRKAIDMKKRRKAKRKAKKRLRPIDSQTVTAIEAAGKDRAALLCDALIGPNVPHRLRKLTSERCQFHADVWTAEQIMRRQRTRVSGTTIANYLASHDQTHDIPKSSLPTRINEARDRCAWFEAEGIWPEFEPA